MSGHGRALAAGLGALAILAALASPSLDPAAGSPIHPPGRGVPPIAAFNFTPPNPVVDEAITFNASASYSPNGTIIAYAWDFGDGTGGSGVVVTHAYPSPGSYEVTLTVMDDQGLANRTERTVPVASRLVAAISANRTSGDIPLEVRFSSNVTGGTPPYAYLWSFGDGAASGEPAPSHTYTSPGNFTVRLEVHDSLGRTANASLALSAALPPLHLAIAANVTSGVVPLRVSFASEASGGIPPYAFSWSFGDNTTASGPNPVHLFGKPGSYLVWVAVVDSAGNRATASLAITALAPLVGGALPRTAGGSAPFRVTFRGWASGGSPPYTYTWDFGDGGQAAGQNATHTFQAPGSYTVTLTVRDSAGRSTTDTVRVNVYGASAPVSSLPLPARALYILGGMGAAGLAAAIVGWRRRRALPPPPPPEGPSPGPPP